MKYSKAVIYRVISLRTQSVQRKSDLKKLDKYHIHIFFFLFKAFSKEFEINDLRKMIYFHRKVIIHFVLRRYLFLISRSE